MTSKITSNIDGEFPIAGQDNSTQGFRTNFTNTNNNFTYAAQEITDLQNKVILKAALTDGTLDNNMFGAEISNPKFKGVRETIYDYGIVSGAVGINFLNSSYFTMTLAGSVILSFSNFGSVSGSQTRFRVLFNVPNAGYTITWPASVTTNLDTIAGAFGQTVIFDKIGTYTFELSTNDGGTSFVINDLSRNRSVVQNGLFAVTANVGNVQQVGVLATVTNQANVTIGNVYATNFIGNIITTGSNSAVFTGNVDVGNLNATYNLYGTIKTPLQPNITLIGTQTALTVSGNANVGNATVSGLTDMCGGSAYGVQYVPSVLNGLSTQILSNVGFFLLHPDATIASHTIVMPATPYNGQAIKIAFANTITTLTHTSGSATVNGALVTGNANIGGTWIYHTTTNAWYRTG